MTGEKTFGDRAIQVTNIADLRATGKPARVA
jgi:hypothetical protein